MDQNQLILDYLLQQGANAPKRDNIARQRALVEQLRARGALPGMRGAGHGYQTAAHPLEFLASAAGQGLGAYKDQQANQAQDTYSRLQQEQLEELRRRMAAMERTDSGGGPRGIGSIGMAGAPLMGQPGY